MILEAAEPHLGGGLDDGLGAAVEKDVDGLAVAGSELLAGDDALAGRAVAQKDAVSQHGRQRQNISCIAGIATLFLKGVDAKSI